MTKESGENSADLQRRERGRKIADKLQNEQRPDEIFSLMAEVFPDFLKVTEERLFGDIWSRQGLSARDRCMISLALIAEKRYGDATYIEFHNKLVKAHVQYALNAGMTKEEILELFLHVANYTCWGAGYQAIKASRDVFAKQK